MPETHKAIPLTQHKAGAPKTESSWAKATRIAGMENHPICPLDDDGGTGLIRERIKAPIRKRGWGLRRKAETAPQAFLGAAAVAIPAMIPRAKPKEPSQPDGPTPATEDEPDNVATAIRGLRKKRTARLLKTPTSRTPR